MNQQQINAHVMLGDVNEAQRLLDEIAGAALTINGNVMRFSKGIEGIGALETARRMKTAIDKNFDRLHQLILKRVYFEAGHRVGYQQGVIETRRAVPDLAAALQNSTIVVIQQTGEQPHEAR